MKFDVSKFVLSALWILILINLFLSFPEWLSITLSVTGLFLVVAHLGEYVVFRKIIAQRPEASFLAFTMTFFFGVLYWKDFPSEPWNK